MGGGGPGASGTILLSHPFPVSPFPFHLIPSGIRSDRLDLKDCDGEARRLGLHGGVDAHAREGAADDAAGEEEVL